MQTLRFSTVLVAASGLLLANVPRELSADCGTCEKDHGHAHAKHGSLGEVAEKAGQFKTLLAALKASGLMDGLSKAGPVTVFAPSDAAFAKLPEGTVEALLNDLPRLRAILKYHVVKGKVPAEEVVKLKHAKTLLGQKVTIKVADGVHVNNAKVIATDIHCDAGIIHAIDSVLLPKADIVDVARDAGSFKTLLTAVEAAGLTDALRGEGPFTVFAPTDSAFAALPEGLVASLLKDKEKLSAVLTFHVVSGSMPASALAKKDAVKTLQGSKVSLKGACCEVSGKTTLTVNGASVVKADISTANGVIHVIDKVILPPTATTAEVE
jgi:uncharacterized surface protein with fasciclin (FAS1) repeats